MKATYNSTQVRCSWWLPGLLLLILLSLSACQPVQAPAASGIPEFTIVVSDAAVSAPAVAPGGIVRVTVKNDSSIPMDIGLARVLEGSTPEEVIALAQGGEEAIIPLLTKASFLPSFNPVEPGAERWAYIDMRTGVFVVDATEHVEGAPGAGALHLNATFTANEIVGTVAPQADVTVEMVDFAYAMPDEIPAGPQLWEFTNNGGQWHMMFVVSLAEGAGVEDVMAFLGDPAAMPPGPPPFEFAPDAGIPPIGVGERVWLESSLAPGEYLVGCPVPDVAAIFVGEMPLMHMQHGMVKMITVAPASTPSNASPGAASAELIVELTDERLVVPETLPAGIRRVTANNTGQEWHAVIFRRLNEGVTPEQFAAAFAESPFDSLALTTQLGGPDLAPGASKSGYFHFQPGAHVLVDNATVPPRFAPFTVVASTEAEAAPPAAAVTVEMKEHAFIMPTEIRAGAQWWQFTNTGENVHQAGIVKLAEGKTLDDAIAWNETGEGPEPFEWVEFWNVMSPGVTSWVELDLPAGAYWVLDFLPDPTREGQSNMALGMAKEIVVTE